MGAGQEPKEWRKATRGAGNGGLHTYIPALWINDVLEEAGIPIEAQLEARVIGIKAEHKLAKVVIELRQCRDKEEDKWLI